MCDALIKMKTSFTHHALRITHHFFEAVTDADFCFDVEAEGSESLKKTIDVSVKALCVTGKFLWKALIVCAAAAT